MSWRRPILARLPDAVRTAQPSACRESGNRSRRASRNVSGTEAPTTISGASHLLTPICWTSSHMAVRPNRYWATYTQEKAPPPKRDPGPQKRKPQIKEKKREPQKKKNPGCPLGKGKKKKK